MARELKVLDYLFKFIGHVFTVGPWALANMSPICYVEKGLMINYNSLKYLQEL